MALTFNFLRLFGAENKLLHTSVEAGWNKVQGQHETMQASYSEPDPSTPKDRDRSLS